jgi:hypothetical protein
MPEDTLVFVSGSSVFMHGLAGKLVGRTRVVLALDSGNRVTAKIRALFPDMLWTRVNHAEVGGVTAAKNWIGSTKAIGLDELEVSPYRRTIVGEVSRPALKGQFGKARAAPTSVTIANLNEEARVMFEAPELVSPNGLWPVNFGVLKMIAPSVYSKTGWVWRELDPSELGTAWDLPVTLVDSLKGLEGGIERQRSEIKSVTRATPCKSLWTFGHAMQCFGLRERTVASLTEAGAGSLERRGFGILVEDYMAEERAGTTGVETGAERRLREAKAAKADDAAVPTYLWNERVLKDWEINADRARLAKSFDSL